LGERDGLREDSDLERTFDRRRLEADGEVGLAWAGLVLALVAQVVPIRSSRVMGMGGLR
jgi:hypothetical protein